MDVSGLKSYAEYTSNLATGSASEQMTNKAQNAKTDAELLEACKEFESYLWEQVIKSMKATINVTGEDSSNSQMVDMFMDTAVSDVAKELTNQSLGQNSLAMQMFEQMKRNQKIDVEALLSQGQVGIGEEES